MERARALLSFGGPVSKPGHIKIIIHHTEIMNLFSKEAVSRSVYTVTPVLYAYTYRHAAATTQRAALRWYTGVTLG